MQVGRYYSRTYRAKNGTVQKHEEDHTRHTRHDDEQLVALQELALHILLVAPEPIHVVDAATVYRPPRLRIVLETLDGTCVVRFGQPRRVVQVRQLKGLAQPVIDVQRGAHRGNVRDRVGHRDGLPALSPKRRRGPATDHTRQEGPIVIIPLELRSRWRHRQTRKKKTNVISRGWFPPTRLRFARVSTSQGQTTDL